MGGSKVDIFIHQSCQIDPLVKKTLWSKRSSGQIDPLVKKPLVNGTSGQRDPLVKRTLWSKEPLVKGTLWSKNLWSMGLWSKFLWSTGLWSKDPHQMILNDDFLINSNLIIIKTTLMKWTFLGFSFILDPKVFFPRTKLVGVYFLKKIQQC